MTQERKSGIVKWFSAQKGYGFIVTDGPDVFVHYQGIAGNHEFKVLHEGEAVSFILAPGKNGRDSCAVDVKVTPQEIVNGEAAEAVWTDPQK